MSNTPQQTQTIEVTLQRYRPEQDPLPWPQTFTVPWTNETSILDVLQHIKDELDSTITFRWSCRMAVCGSCSVMVNGEPKLACSTFIRDYPADVRTFTIAPLDNFDIEKDLVVDLNPAIRKLESVQPWIIRYESQSLGDGEYLQTPAQLAKFKDYTMCINCFLCFAACPQIGMNEKFLGPAVIALATRYNYDNRDQGSAQRNDRLYTEDGVWPCTFVGYCSEVCPKHVDPAGAIQQGKAAGIFYQLGKITSGSKKE